MLAICYFVLPPSSLLFSMIQIEVVVTKELRNEFPMELNSDPITEKQTYGLGQILCFWILSIVLSLSKTPSCLFFKTQRFRVWVLSPSSGKTYSVGSKRWSLCFEK
jgi:hypothetical protein